MNCTRHSGRLAGGLGLALALVWLAVLARPSSGDAAPGVDGGDHRIYLPVVQRFVPTATPTSTATPTPTPTPTGDCSTAPVLVAPADNATLKTLIPNLQWDSGQNPNATETNVQVYSDPGLTHRVDWGSSRYHPRGPYSWRFDDNYEPATTYYWLAFIECGTIQGPNSQVRSFTTGSGGVILPGPSLLKPADNTTLTGTSLATSWSPVGGAQEYEQYLAHGTYCCAWGTGTETHDSWSGLKPNTIYEWWVRARNDYAWGAESVHWHVTTGAASAAWPGSYAAPGTAGRTFLVQGGGGATIEVQAP